MIKLRTLSTGTAWTLSCWPRTARHSTLPPASARSTSSTRPGGTSCCCQRTGTSPSPSSPTTRAPGLCTAILPGMPVPVSQPIVIFSGQAAAHVRVIALGVCADDDCANQALACKSSSARVISLKLWVGRLPSRRLSVYVRIGMSTMRSIQLIKRIRVFSDVYGLVSDFNLLAGFNRVCSTLAIIRFNGEGTQRTFVLVSVVILFPLLFFSLVKDGEGFCCITDDHLMFESASCLGQAREQAVMDMNNYVLLLVASPAHIFGCSRWLKPGGVDM